MGDLVTEERRPDSPSALRELATDQSSRRRFLKMVGGTGAAGALAIFLAACGDDNETGAGSTAATTSTAADASGDLDVLNYALTLEYLEADFYEAVVASGLFKGAQLSLIQSFGEHEQAHVEALMGTVTKLGGTPVAKPKTKFPLENANAVVELAATVENLGAAAYLAEAGKITSKEVLAAALSIHSVEARHAAALNTLLKKPITPDGPFAKPAEREQVLAAVKPFIV